MNAINATTEIRRTLIDNSIDAILNLYDNLPAWHATCVKIEKIKDMHFTSAKYCALQKVIAESPFFIIVPTISEFDYCLIKRLEFKAINDPKLTRLDHATREIVLDVMRKIAPMYAVFAFIPEKLNQILDVLIAELNREGKDENYEAQLRILEGVGIMERLNYIEWFRNQPLNRATLTAWAAFSMCMTNLNEMTAEEQKHWQANYNEMCGAFKENSHVYLHLLSLKQTSRNCQCLVL